PRSQPDVDAILQIWMLAVGQDRHAGDIGGPADDALAIKKSEHQLALVPRRPHHHRERGAADADFQRLLGGELVIDPEAGLLAVAKHTRAVRASVVQRTDPNEHPPSRRRSCRHRTVPSARDEPDTARRRYTEGSASDRRARSLRLVDSP